MLQESINGRSSIGWVSQQLGYNFFFTFFLLVFVRADGFVCSIEAVLQLESNTGVGKKK